MYFLVNINLATADTDKLMPELFPGFRLGMTVEQLKSKRSIVNVTEYESDGIHFMEKFANSNNIFRSIFYDTNDGAIVKYTLNIKPEYSNKSKFDEFVSDGVARWGKQSEGYLQTTSIKKKKINEKQVVAWKLNDYYIEIIYSKDLLQFKDGLDVMVSNNSYHDFIKNKFKYDISKLAEIEKKPMQEIGVEGKSFVVKNDNLYKLP
jgi:hypothetical protein